MYFAQYSVVVDVIKYSNHPEIILKINKVNVYCEEEHKCFENVVSIWTN